MEFGKVILKFTWKDIQLGGGIYIYNVKNTYLENTHRIANFGGKTRMMENLSYLI